MNADEKGAAGAPRPEQVAELLRSEIVTGLWPVDADLPPERELMQRFQVSRPTYRESLRLLESQGLIKRKRGAKGGARILLPSAKPVTRYAGAYLQSHSATGDDLWRTILIVEPAAVRAMVECRDPQAIAELAACVARQASTVSDLQRFIAEELKFRMLLLEHCGNVTLALLGTILIDLAKTHSRNIDERRPNNAHAERYMRESLVTKDRLLRLIEAGAALDAERLWHGYVASALRRTQALAQEAGLLRLYLRAEDVATTSDPAD
jgi:DNA-binding FadR family transcriptional regulator